MIKQPDTLEGKEKRLDHARELFIMTARDQDGSIIEICRRTYEAAVDDFYAANSARYARVRNKS